MTTTIKIPTGEYGDVPVECEIVGKFAVHPIFIPDGDGYDFSENWYTVAHPGTGCKFGFDSWRIQEARELAQALSNVPGIEALDTLGNPRERLVKQDETLVRVKDVLTPECFDATKKVLAEFRARRQDVGQ